MAADTWSRIERYEHVLNVNDSPIAIVENTSHEDDDCTIYIQYTIHFFHPWWKRTFRLGNGYEPVIVDGIPYCDLREHLRPHGFMGSLSITERRVSFSERSD